MKIELVEGEDLVLVTGLESVTGMATDGYFIPAEKYAKENGLSDSNIRVLKRRKRVEAITLFGRTYVKKDSKPSSRSYKKRAKVQILDGTRHEL